MSRSTLHEHFVAMVGQPPMQYLANWRMQLGAMALRESHATVAAIAQDVGYESEAAFARAFVRGPAHAAECRALVRACDAACACASVGVVTGSAVHDA